MTAPEWTQKFDLRKDVAFMIHRKAVFMASLLLVFCLVFSGCSSSEPDSSSSNVKLEGAITPGTWQDNTFINGWSNLKVTLPEGYTARSEAEMGVLFEAGTNVTVNNGSTTKDQLDFDKLSTFYDFFVTFPDDNTNLTLSYQSLISENNKDTTESQYFNTIRQQLEADEDLNFTVKKEYDVMIAGEKFFAGHTSINDGAVYQDYFLRKVDGAMICLLASYTKDSAESMQNFLNSSITSVQ